MLLSDELVTTQTMSWVKEFIVALNVCPFAKREVERETVRCVVLRSKKMDVALEELMAEVQWLDEHPETETTLLIFPTLFKDFHRYLDFVETAENVMFDQGCEGVYQLVDQKGNFERKTDQADKLECLTQQIKVLENRIAEIDGNHTETVKGNRTIKAKNITEDAGTIKSNGGKGVCTGASICPFMVKPHVDVSSTVYAGK